MDATEVVRVDYNEDPITADPEFRRKVRGGPGGGYWESYGGGHRIARGGVGYCRLGLGNAARGQLRHNGADCQYCSGGLGGKHCRVVGGR